LKQLARGSPQRSLGVTIYEPDRGDRYDVILTNQPFGTKGANQAPPRDDFTIETSNKQLNFVQHCQFCIAAAASETRKASYSVLSTSIGWIDAARRAGK
jgi:hypothetical protein